MHSGRTICAIICALLTAAVWAANPLALTNPASIAEDRAFYLSGASFLGNDFSPIKEIRAGFGNSYEPHDGQNRALIAARVESGLDWHGWRIGSLYRLEWLGTTQRETLDLYRTDRLSLGHPVGLVTPVDYKLDGFAASGLQLGKALSFNLDSGWTTRLGTSVSLLQGKKIRKELWHGNALATAEHSLSFSGDAMRTWAMNPIYDNIVNSFAPAYRVGAPPAGRGYSVDLGMHVEHQDGTFVEWTIADVASKIYWTSVPQITYSGSGVYNGAFPEGKKWRVNFNERLPVKQSWALSIPVRQAHIELSDNLMQGKHFSAIGLRKQFSSELSTKLDYDLRFGTVGIELVFQSFRLQFRTDAIKLTQAHAYGLDIGMRIGF